ncbi:MAG: hypothetical protein U0941_19355 [Planctomycetaceae bacterium]
MSNQRSLFDEPETPICSQCHGQNLRELPSAPGRFRCSDCNWLNVIGSNGQTRPAVNPWQAGKAKR